MRGFPEKTQIDSQCPRTQSRKFKSLVCIEPAVIWRHVNADVLTSIFQPTRTCASSRSSNAAEACDEQRELKRYTLLVGCGPESDLAGEKVRRGFTNYLGRFINIERLAICYQVPKCGSQVYFCYCERKVIMKEIRTLDFHYNKFRFRTLFSTFSIIVNLFN